MPKNQQMIFVYNAKSGFMHSMTDLFHKAAKPNTYPCKLCSLTYSGAFMKKMLKEYIARLDTEAVFFHKDEFIKVYPNYKTTFPVVLLADGKKLIKLIGDNDFKTMNDLDDLINLISKRLPNAKK